jgi:hypothetical protein
VRRKQALEDTINNRGLPVRERAVAYVARLRMDPPSESRERALVHATAALAWYGGGDR